MRTQIKRLHLAFHGTSVYVTHDQTEAMTLADRIVALRDGRIEQVGSPDDLYARPVNRFIAGFIGSPTMNFLDAKLTADDDGLAVVPNGGPALRVPAALVERYREHVGRDVVFGIRPEDLTNTWTEERRDEGAAVPVDVTVEITEPLGSDKLIFGRHRRRRGDLPGERHGNARRRKRDAGARPHGPHASLRSGDRRRALKRRLTRRRGRGPAGNERPSGSRRRRGRR